ncbi:MAG: DegV family protein [Desulfobacterales bacterium]|nr:DegV family protein [Desulfobacterales bacterium]
MAKKIALVCDSTADFPPGMAEQLGLNILPVHIFVNGKDHLHGKTISNAEVMKNLRKKKRSTPPRFIPLKARSYTTACCRNTMRWSLFTCPNTFRETTKAPVQPGSLWAKRTPPGSIFLI